MAGEPIPLPENSAAAQHVEQVQPEVPQKISLPNGNESMQGSSVVNRPDSPALQSDHTSLPHLTDLAGVNTAHEISSISSDPAPVIVAETSTVKPAVETGKPPDDVWEKQKKQFDESVRTPVAILAEPSAASEPVVHAEIKNIDHAHDAWNNTPFPESSETQTINGRSLKKIVIEAGRSLGRSMVLNPGDVFSSVKKESVPSADELRVEALSAQADAPAIHPSGVVVPALTETGPVIEPTYEALHPAVQSAVAAEAVISAPTDTIPAVPVAVQPEQAMPIATDPVISAPAAKTQEPNKGFLSRVRNFIGGGAK